MKKIVMAVLFLFLANSVFRACSHNEELTKWQEKQIVRDK
jgi:hypothetical protein